VAGAYLAFGDTYGPERDEAERRRWPVSTLPAEHLHLLTNPDQVATELVDLMNQLGISFAHGLLEPLARTSHWPNDERDTRRGGRDVVDIRWCLVQDDGLVPEGPPRGGS